MRVALISVILALSPLHPQKLRASGHQVIAAQPSSAQNPASHADADQAPRQSNISELLASYQKQLEAIDSAYQKLATLQPPLRYASGKILTPEMIESHRKSVAGARRTFQEFQAHPRNSAAAIRLLIRTETLTEDLTGLAELSYDSDQEELAQSLNKLTADMDGDKHLIVAWALQLTSQLQQRVQRLEQENRSLALQLNEAKEQQGAKHPSAP